MKSRAILAGAMALLSCAGSFGAAQKTVEARLSGLAPEGFTASRSAQLFGTEKRPLKDGTIFTYMDGGAVAYVQIGFLELFHAEYADGRNDEIVLDVFTFADASGAAAAIADGRICPAGGTQLPFAPSGRAHRYPPDYYLYFVSGARLIYGHISDDRLSGTLDRFAAAVKAALEKENP